MALTRDSRETVQAQVRVPQSYFISSFLAKQYTELPAAEWQAP